MFGRPAIAAHSATPALNKPSDPTAPRRLDKQRFEAGQQCHKRLWLDCHAPVQEPASASRLELSRVGDELRDLARTAFPKGIAVEADDVDAAAEETAARLKEAAPVLFDAVFVSEGAVARCDILVVHKDKQVDLFEIKSGTKVKHRYVNDLALQAATLAENGYKVQRAYLLHINPKYDHTRGEPYPPMQLLRSSDVTAKVAKQQANVERKLQNLRAVIDREEAPAQPMGTHCRSPFACPHVQGCTATTTGLPLTRLPELTRLQEHELRKDGIAGMLDVPPDREGLTFRQRRTLQSHADSARIVEPFLGEELQECERPLHFLAAVSITDPLPRLDHQRPWQRTPYGWAVQTVHEDGRVERQSFVQVDRDDPRPGFVKSLARHLEMGGTALVWGDECLRELRPLLDSIPDEKASLRALLGRDHLDLRALLQSSVFDPEMHDSHDLAAVCATLLEDDSGRGIEALNPEVRFELVHKARAPRVRATTKEKIGGIIAEALEWQVERLFTLYETFASAAAPPPAEADDTQDPGADPSA